MKSNNYFANVERSKVVREKLLYVREELGLTYKVIGKNAGFSVQILSPFVKNRRNLNDVSLDRLEPVLDSYLKALGEPDELLGGR